MAPHQNARAAALDGILQRQRAWAKDIDREEPHYADYVLAQDGNLFQPLKAPTLADFQKGSGGEFKRRRHKKTGAIFPPKFNALKSSSVLVCNVFDNWRGGGEALVGEALNCQPHAMVEMEFEAQFENGVSPRPCNLDLALHAKDGWVCAVEGKFTEPLGRKSPLKSQYLPQLPQPTPWKSAGLKNCDTLAREHSEYTLLDVPQLLKHILGLHRTLKGRDAFRLTYLYYDFEGELGQKHADEVKQFKDTIDGEIDFASMTYQTLVPRMKELSNGKPEKYFSYLKDRYHLG